MANADMCLDAARKAFPDNEELRVAYMIGFNEGFDRAMEQPSLPSNLDEAAFDYAELCKYDGVDKLLCAEHFKAGATWRESQMKMPNSSELIAAWDEAKSVLREKDFRGDEWRLAYNAFMFGFSKGLNIKREK